MTNTIKIRFDDKPVEFREEFESTLNSLNKDDEIFIASEWGTQVKKITSVKSYIESDGTVKGLAFTTTNSDWSADAEVEKLEKKSGINIAPINIFLNVSENGLIVDEPHSAAWYVQQAPGVTLTIEGKSHKIQTRRFVFFQLIGGGKTYLALNIITTPL